MKATLRQAAALVMHCEAVSWDEALDRLECTRADERAIIEELRLEGPSEPV